jgi:hypothetical protein
MLGVSSIGSRIVFPGQRVSTRIFEMSLSRSGCTSVWSSLLIVATLLPASGLRAVADEPKADGPASRAVLDKLEEKIDLGFQERTPLWDVVNYMSVASSGPDGKGFSFDFDEAVEKAGKGRNSPIPIALEGKGIRIKTALKKVLEPMGLTYSVREGVLLIKAKPAEGSKKS